MTDLAAWSPNNRFLQDVGHFADLAKSEEFFENEVGYKRAAAAILGRVVRPASVAQPGGAVRFADALSGTLDAASVDVEPDERELLSRFNYSSALYNLLGAGRGAAVQRGSLASWARNSSEDHVRQALQDLFNEAVSVARRVDAFRDLINHDYGRLHQEGFLKASRKPTIGTPMVALLLALADPADYTLYREDINLQAAADFAYPLDRSTGTVGQRYERVVEMQQAFANAMRLAGCEVPDLLRVHDFLWVRSKGSGLAHDRWTAADFEAMDTGQPNGQSKQDVSAAIDRLKRVGQALRDHIAGQLPNRRLRMDILGTYPPSRSTWPWVVASVNEAGSGSPTAWPQLNAELRAEGLDVFFSFDLAKAVNVPELRDAVRRASEARESPQLLQKPTSAGYRDWEASGKRFMMRKRFAVEEVVTWPNLGIERLRDEMDILLPLYRFVLPDGPLEHPGNGGVPDRSLAQAVRAAVAADGLVFSDEDVDSAYLALRTKPFLILTGLSGTGKTKLAMTIADVLCDPDTRGFASVRPDWTDSKGLLGFHNLLTDRYHTTPALELLLHAEEEWRAVTTEARPHLLILDEMNLARVEHYFADFLSAFESRRLDANGMVTGEPIALHDREYVASSGDGLDVPGNVAIPPNFYVIGTVNVDETTHPFSRKVLDRANTLELFDVDLTAHAPVGVVRPDAGEAMRVRSHFTRAGQFIELQAPDLRDPLLAELVRVNGALERRRLHFGYRVRDEILHFVQQAGEEGFFGVDDPRTVAFDVQIVSKVLPKLSGSRERLEQPLRDLLILCFAHDGQAWLSAIGSDRYAELFVQLTALRRESPAEPRTTEAAPETDDTGSDAPASPEAPAIAAQVQRNLRDLMPTDLKYPRAARKIARMLMQLQEEGYASFFE